MVGAIVCSPTDAENQKAVMESAQRVVVARARAPRDAAVQHYHEYLASWYPGFELEESARPARQFEGVLPKAATCVAHAPVDVDGQVGFAVDVPPEVYELVLIRTRSYTNSFVSLYTWPAAFTLNMADTIDIIEH